MNRVAVLGAGTWGTALAIQACRAGATVGLWSRDPGRAARLAATRAHPALPGCALPDGVAPTADLAVALAGASLAIVAVPMQALRGLLATLPPGAPPLLLCAKGIDAATLALPTELAPGGMVLSGPNFAAEIAAGLPAAAVVAATCAAPRDAAIAALATPGFRLYGSDDPIGVQVGGAAKNVVAIAAGAVAGAGLGENARAALVTRGLAEMARFAVAIGGRAETLAGLAGLGDTLLSATGPTSRNYALGAALARGEAPAAALAEGAATAPALLARAAAVGVDMPVAAAVAALLAGRLAVADAVVALLGRPLRAE